MFGFFFGTLAKSNVKPSVLAGQDGSRKCDHTHTHLGCLIVSAAVNAGPSRRGPFSSLGKPVPMLAML